MDILIVSHFGSTYSENDNDRFLYLAKSLDQKNNVEIVTSSFCHEKKIHRNQTEVSWPFKITSGFFLFLIYLYKFNPNI